MKEGNTPKKKRRWIWKMLIAMLILIGAGILLWQYVLPAAGLIAIGCIAFDSGDLGDIFGW